MRVRVLELVEWDGLSITVGGFEESDEIECTSWLENTRYVSQ